MHSTEHKEITMNRFHILNKKDATMPSRGSNASAGYDVHLTEDVTLKPNERKLTFTGVALELDNDKVAELHIRSSVGVKKGVILSNGTGIIDSDYYANESNGGDIGIPLWNTSKKTVEFKKGERVAQIIIKQYYTVVDCGANGNRTGGFGSSGK